MFIRREITKLPYKGAKCLKIALTVYLLTQAGRQELCTVCSCTWLEHGTGQTGGSIKMKQEGGGLRMGNTCIPMADSF